MPRARSHSMGLLLLLGCAWVARCGLSCFSASSPQAAPGLLERAGLRGRANQARTSLAARGGEAATLAAAAEEEESDTVEVGGFSALVVGLALLPYVVYCLVAVFDATVGGKELTLGPYGLELVACICTVFLTLWSLASYVQRGCGLPAGPLGLLGLAEGLSYLGSLGLAVAVVAANVRTGGPSTSPSLQTSPSLPTLSSIKAPEIKAPEFKAPSIKVPEFKAPDIKVPEIKVPEIKAPELPKVSEVKVPEALKPKAPEAPKPKAPEAPKPKAPEAPPKPAPAPEAPKPKAPEAPKPKAPEAPAKPALAPEASKPKAPEAPPKPALAPEAAKKAPTKPTEVVDDYSDLFN